MIDAWDEDHICSSCIQSSFFAHECSPHDSSVIAHVPHVRQTIASTSLSHYIQEAHKPHNTSLRASNPVSMNTSFFLQAEGHSAGSTGDRSPIHQYESNNDETDNQSDSHYAKTIRNPITIRTMLTIATVTMITTVSMTTIRYTVIARTQATNGN
jgi:hypothetical protein